MKKSLFALAATLFSGTALMKFAAVATVATAVNVIDSDKAHSMCLAYGPQAGTWMNVDPNTREITRIRINYSCNDTIARGTGTPRQPETPQRRLSASWTVSLWGKCHPRDCAWGGAPAEAMPVGNAENIVAHYDQGFATRRAVMRMRDGRLQLILTSTYRDGRPTRKTGSWFYRVGR